jgi:uncharacterized protein YbaR (Trm112 family)
MINEKLLEILCCPETHQSLRPADAATLDRINQQLAAGTARNRAGKPVTEKLQEGLLREDGKFLYPVRNNIPVMLIDEAIPVPA